MTKLIDEMNTVASVALTEFQKVAEEHTTRHRIESATREPYNTTSTTQGHPRTTHKLFPDVDPEQFSSFKPRNPYLEPNVLQADSGTGTTAPNIRDPTYSPKPARTANEGAQQTTNQGFRMDDRTRFLEDNELPHLYYDSIMKRAQVQFAGKHDILVFYNQLRNGVAHYGLYLRPVEEFALGRSLCPDEYQGMLIDDNRYKLMAACLYQKLASFDTVPAELLRQEQ
mmetsp:Transcript_1093/g.1656  ORF Transcript_1093/g.1656 Transcript_1093/m.1656 type:complete len:226 (+) Transcript_1093:828-1505(+)